MHILSISIGIVTGGVFVAGVCLGWGFAGVRECDSVIGTPVDIIIVVDCRRFQGFRLAFAFLLGRGSKM